MDNALASRLEEIGKPALKHQNPDGSGLLILPHGGRVLGLYAPNSDENFLWNHSALKTPDSAKAFYAGDDWHNSGGDRTWLAPEVDFFLPDYPKTDRYFQPRQLDPGRYEASTVGNGVRLVNRLTCTLVRSKKAIALEITKTISPAPNPLRHERGERLASVAYAGFTLHTALDIVGEVTACVGTWNLLQMPHGGDMLIPTYARAAVTTCFGEIRADNLLISDRLVRWRMCTGGAHKIAVRAAATTGRVGYLHQTGRQMTLIIRNFLVDPSGEYVDVPWTDASDLGYAVQACSVVDEKMGSFSELEYHVPAIGLGTGRTRSEDCSQVWAFRGEREAIRDVADRLLGAHALLQP